MRLWWPLDHVGTLILPNLASKKPHLHVSFACMQHSPCSPGSFLLQATPGNFRSHPIPELRPSAILKRESRSGPRLAVLRGGLFRQPRTGLTHLHCQAEGKKTAPHCRRLLAYYIGKVKISFKWWTAGEQIFVQDISRGNLLTVVIKESIPCKKIH